MKVNSFKFYAHDNKIVTYCQLDECWHTSEPFVFSQATTLAEIEETLNDHINAFHPTEE